MAEEETTETTSEETTAAAETEETTSEETTVPEPNWKQESRKHERRAKQTANELAAAQAKLKELEQAGASETEKAIAKAREEEAAKVRSEFETERRGDRLELAVTREATRGLTIQDDGETRTVKFADPDDALVNLERAIAKGDVSPDDIFDSEGKVQTDALQAALTELLERKPHLIDTNGTSRVAGSADGGKGTPAKGPEEQSADEVFESIQKTRK